MAWRWHQTPSTRPRESLGRATVTPSTRVSESRTQDFGDGEKNPNLITPEKYNELVKKHVMFKDMAADTYLASAGIADDWPYGRGCWQSDDKQCIVWFGEEDQL